MSQTDSEYLNLLRARYRKASKKERTAILDEYEPPYLAEFQWNPG